MTIRKVTSDSRLGYYHDKPQPVNPRVGWCSVMKPTTPILFDNVATERKHLVIIPGADHNDILIRDMALYFGAVEEFVYAYAR